MRSVCLESPGTFTAGHRFQHIPCSFPVTVLASVTDTGLWIILLKWAFSVVNVALMLLTLKLFNFYLSNCFGASSLRFPLKLSFVLQSV